MNFKQFQSFICEARTGVESKSQSQFYGYIITEAVDGRFFINDQETEFVSLEEAQDHISQQRLKESIQQELYQEMSNNTIAEIIRSHHESVKVTNTLVESYVELASSKLFTPDKVVNEIRELNKIDRVLPNYADFKLDDGTVVVVSEQTQQRLNNILHDNNDVVKYMRESRDNFLEVLNLLEE